jgi:pyrimidine-nucleoside phosphorylase
VNFLSLIEAKRDGAILNAGQIGIIVQEYTAGRLPDYQMAAFLMAVYFRGLNAQETTALTLAMRDSGDQLDFPKDTRPLVDKHSTGGVGDKVSLPLAPLLACLGFRVPMISGRGLGITGGTLDKLDSIPGFKTSLPPARIIQIVQEVGCVICGQTERMVPADKAMYALRDVTGTVSSIPLIVASILSKKLAEGLQALILDVKCGAAAFMPNREKARELASAMVSLGNSCGVNTRALITNMDVPLGRAAGNWLEVKESDLCLQPGKGPSGRIDDLREIVLACAAHLLVQTGRAASLPDAQQTAADCLASGKPLSKWREMLAAQGADLVSYEQKLKQDHTASIVLEITSPGSGYISKSDGRLLGEIIRDLGGGRLRKEFRIDYGVGIDRLAKPGDAVRTGDLLARIHASDQGQGSNAAMRAENAFDLSDTPPTVENAIIGQVV